MTPALSEGSLPAGVTYDKFVDALRVLEARGQIVVLKWPAHAADTFRVVLTGATANGKGAA